jgi:hypothetical protein
MLSALLARTAYLEVRLLLVVQLDFTEALPRRSLYLIAFHVMLVTTAHLDPS